MLERILLGGALIVASAFFAASLVFGFELRHRGGGPIGKPLKVSTVLLLGSAGISVLGGFEGRINNGVQFMTSLGVFVGIVALVLSIGFETLFPPKDG